MNAKTAHFIKYPYKLLCLYLGSRSLLSPLVLFDKYTWIDPTSRVGPGSNVCSSSIGRYSYLSQNCRIPFAKVGSFCSIGSNVECCFGTHPISTNVSTSPVFHSSHNPLKYHLLDDPRVILHKFVSDNYVCHIGSDVWIGSHVKIFDGVTIGHGAVIGLGSVVTKDIPPYAVVAGIPARVLRYRFSKHEIDQLLQVKWWDLPLHYLKNLAHLFNKPSQFFSHIKSLT